MIGKDAYAILIMLFHRFFFIGFDWWIAIVA